MPRNSISSRFATSTIGCAAVPSTCSPTLTNRFATAPVSGERSRCARVEGEPVRARRPPAAGPQRRHSARCARLPNPCGPRCRDGKGLRCELRELCVFEIGFRLLLSRFRLLNLVLIGTAIECGEHLAGFHTITLRHIERGDPTGNQGADANVLIRQRGDGAVKRRVSEMSARERRLSG